MTTSVSEFNGLMKTLKADDEMKDTIWQYIQVIVPAAVGLTVLGEDMIKQIEGVAKSVLGGGQ